MSTQTIRTEHYIETSNSDHLLERIDHMRRLLADKDKEIKVLKVIIENYERIMSMKLKLTDKESVR